MLSFLTPTIIFPTLLLAVGLSDDLHRKKVSNKLIILLMGITLVYVLVYFGLPGIKQALLAGVCAFILTFPLFLARILGGGDVKLFFIFAFATLSPTAALWTLIFSVICGSVLGLLQIIFAGELKSLLNNLFGIITFNKVEGIKLHSIPYTAALLLGWMTYVTFSLTKGAVL